MTELKQRMYVLVNRSLSPIQKGIQALHAVARYARKFGTNEDFIKWVDIDETVILLDGGTSNKTKLEDGTFKGTLENMLTNLIDNGYKVTSFYEEDTNDMLTAIAFLADERVWDMNKYPDFIYNGPSTSFFMDPNRDKAYTEWIHSMGGEDIVYLRKFLGSKKLAN